MKIVLGIVGIIMFVGWLLGGKADVLIILATIYIVASMVIDKIEDESRKEKK